MVRSLFFLLPLMALISYSPNFALAQATTDTELKHVRLQLKWRHQFQFAGYYVAKEKGYYRDAGLDVELVERSANTTPIDQLMGGRVDFAVADSGVLLYRSTGVPLVVLAAIFQHSPSILITLDDITDLSQLRHKRAMLGGGYMNAELITMLQKAGVSIDDINVSPPNTSVAALIGGETDAYNAYTTNEPYLLTQRGIGFNIFKPRDYGVDFYGDILITNEAMVQRNPQLVEAFREASLKGWKYAVEHQQEAIELILANYNSQNKSPDHLRFEAIASSKLVLSEIVPIGYVNKERWQRIEEVFRDQGLLNQPIDYTHFLYQSPSSEGIWDLLYQHRTAIGASLVLFCALMIVLHNLHLRRQVALRTHQLDDARIQAEVEARTDALTGLPNRRHFFETGEHYIGQAERRGIELSMISMDLDYFKKINDSYGHAAGDAALVEVSQRLRRHLRKDDVVARLGGEEFSVACLGSDLQSTQVLAARILDSIQETEITSGEYSFKCTASVGVACWAPGDSFDELVRKADIALYEAKAAGRNQIKTWAEQA